MARWEGQMAGPDLDEDAPGQAVADGGAPGPVPDWETIQDLTGNYLKDCGFEIVTPDAISQMTEVFLPCLQIMCDRGYDMRGMTWRAAGWRPQLYEMMKKMARIRFHGWRASNKPGVLTEIPDLINYAGFLQRGLTEGLKPWGEWEEPG